MCGWMTWRKRLWNWTKTQTVISLRDQNDNLKKQNKKTLYMLGRKTMKEKHADTMTILNLISVMRTCYNN